MEIKTRVGMDLWDFMYQPLLDPEYHELIHLSHADLDGYGCTAITDFFRLNAPAGTEKSATYHYYNTTSVGEDRIFAMLDRAFSERLSVGMHRRFHVLITDLGGINIDTLLKRYAHVNHGDVEFLVVDHHRSIYDDMAVVDELFTPSDTDTELPKTSFGEIGDYNILGMYIGRIFTITYQVNNIGCSMIFGHDCAATKIWGGLVLSLLLDHNRLSNTKYTSGMIDRTKRFCDLVSRYDTGNFGEWYIPEDAITFEMCNIGGVDIIFGLVSDQNIMNMRCHIAHEHKTDDDNPPMQFVRTMSASLCGSSRLFNRYDQEVVARFIEMSKLYDIFRSRVVMCDSKETNILPYKVYQACQSYGKVYAHVINDNTKNANMNLYATRLFHELSDSDVVFVWYWPADPNTGKVRYEFRSPSDGNANCYEIAKSLGGGGHPHASGAIL